MFTVHTYEYRKQMTHKETVANSEILQSVYHRLLIWLLIWFQGGFHNLIVTVSLKFRNDAIYRLNPVL